MGCSREGRTGAAYWEPVQTSSVSYGTVCGAASTPHGWTVTAGASGSSGLTPVTRPLGQGSAGHAPGA